MLTGCQAPSWVGGIQKNISTTLSPSTSSGETLIVSESGATETELSIMERISLARARYSNRNFVEQ